MKSHRVTIKDIAEIAGVSFSTVSRCLNDSPLVSDKTKEKVGKIADEMGFEFNASARGLITREVGTVGIVLPEQYTKISVNVYHGMLMNSLRTSLEQADVDLIVTYKQNHFTGQNNITRLVTRRKIDGLILLVEEIDDETLSFLKKHQVPFVCSHYPPRKNIQDQDVIFTDHLSGGRLVAEHLIEKGRNKFAHISVGDNHLEFSLRARGFSEALQRTGLVSREFFCDSTVESTYKLVKSRLDEFRQFDALFAMNDLMAIGAIKAFKEEGLSVPEDISVVGYDDSEYGQYFSPGLTTIHQPKEELAVLSCQRLFFQMEKQKAGLDVMKKLISIQPVLVIRDST
ncbi:MAG: LacI family DNA-binding transcriptional regulator [Spirochaetales bacterium]|nr:LacI family DNA-binding transcriptional regulator [Spirochaetales bacterium]